ncbi:DUF4865 family protein [Pantoea sp. USHLN298]|uniref:DUF4865 family protein n=1 Tax=Pantoea sp. USHLN298 TaxID=3081294 RepID=UPI003019F2E8
MIVMHYRFTLPADYPMTTIEQRIRLNGARLNGFPGLIAKAFLYARRDDEELAVAENRYAPLYFWQDASAMQRFLQSAGFQRLVDDFGWPVIESWLALNADGMPDNLDQARFIALRRWPIAPHSCLADLASETGFCAWDVSRWQGVTVTASAGRPAGEQDVYRIGYLARGTAASGDQTG